MTRDGQTYERGAIEGWFGTGSSTSPLTGLPLRSRELIPNIALRGLIEEYNLKINTNNN